MVARCPQSSTPPPLPSRRQRPRTCGSQGPRRRAPSPPQKLPRRPRARARAVSKRYMIIVARGGILRRQSPAQSCEGRQSASRGQHGRCARVCKACTVCVKPCTQNCTDHCSLLKTQDLSRTGGVPSRHHFVPRRSNPSASLRGVPRESQVTGALTRRRQRGARRSPARLGAGRYIVCSYLQSESCALAMLEAHHTTLYCDTQAQLHT